MGQTTRRTGSADRRGKLARAAAQGGFEDVHVVSRETATEVLTPRRTELLDYLGQHEVSSVRDLARGVERDKGTVSRDLALLAEHDLVVFDADGARKVPRLAHTTILVEPLT
jgi:predicted transcriptional regulator